MSHATNARDPSGLMRTSQGCSPWEAPRASRTLQHRLNDSLDGIIDAEQRTELLAGVRDVGLLLKQTSTFTAQLEKRHSNVIKMSKIRADTRVKNHAGQQADAFMVMLKRLTVILEEQLSPGDFAAFQKRIAKDLKDIPTGMVDGSNSIAR